MINSRISTLFLCSFSLLHKEGWSYSDEHPNTVWVLRDYMPTKIIKKKTIKGVATLWPWIVWVTLCLNLLSLYNFLISYPFTDWFPVWKMNYIVIPIKGLVHNIWLIWKHYSLICIVIDVFLFKWWKQICLLYIKAGIVGTVNIQIMAFFNFYMNRG